MPTCPPAPLRFLPRSNGLQKCPYNFKKHTWIGRHGLAGSANAQAEVTQSRVADSEGTPYDNALLQPQPPELGRLEDGVRGRRDVEDDHTHTSSTLSSIQSQKITDPTKEIARNQSDQDVNGSDNFKNLDLRVHSRSYRQRGLLHKYPGPIPSLESSSILPLSPKGAVLQVLEALPDSSSLAHKDAVYRWRDRVTELYRYGRLRYVKTDPEILESVLKRMVYDQGTVESIEHIWKHSKPRYPESESRKLARGHLWEDMMLHCMAKSPRNALRLLCATYRTDKHVLPTNSTAHCLNYIARYYVDGQASPDYWALSTIRSLTTQLLQKPSEPSPDVPAPNMDHVIRFWLKHKNHPASLRLVSRLLTAPYRYTGNTLLHLVDYFADSGNAEVALQVLQYAVESKFPLSYRATQSACGKVLRMPYAVANPDIDDVKILTRILQMGIQPSITTTNVIILNAVDSQDFELALHIFDLLKDVQVSPDAYTYAIMLQGAKAKRDPEVLQRLISEALSNPAVVKSDLHLLWEILESIYVRQHLIKQPSYPALFKIYEEYLKLDVLKDLGIYRPRSDSPSPKNLTSESEPTTRILNLMIRSYVVTYRATYEPVNVYERYRGLIAAKNPLILSTTESDYVANGFLLAFMWKAKTVLHCSNVIRDMLEDANSHEKEMDGGSIHSETQTPASETSSPLAAVQQDTSCSTSQAAAAGAASSSAPISSIYKPTLPTSLTWSLLVDAYVKQGLQHGAQTVLNTMRQYGIETTPKTWNFIINSLVRRGNVRETVAAVVQMQADGHPINPETMRALGKIHNQDHLFREIEKAGQAQPAERGSESQDTESSSTDMGEFQTLQQAMEENPDMAEILEDPELSLDDGETLDNWEMLDDDDDASKIVTS